MSMAVSANLVLTASAFADDIERKVLGTVKQQTASSSFTKVKEIDGITYGLTRHKDAVGNFDKVTVDRWLANENKWAETPQTIFTNQDVRDAGAAQGENYTYNQFEALKWFTCPGSGKMSFYAKRINADANGTKDYINGKQLFGATVTTSAGEADSVYNAIRIGFPYGTASGDLGNMSVDGKSYIISAGRDDHTIRFIQLTDDCSDIVDANVPDAEPANTLQWYKDDGSAEPREAPSIFQHNGYFYVMTSGATGWRPNQQKYAYSQDFLGEWSEMISIGDRTAYHSQVFWVKGIEADNGSGQQAKIFSGTRNAQVWNEKSSDSRDVWTPIYFNTPESLATNYYDYIDINHTSGDITGGHYDHGTRLTISSAHLEGFADSLANIIDGDESTSWYKGNESGRDVIVYDLGSPQMVKAMKLKQYDNFNTNKLGEVEQKVFKIRVEVGDGTNYNTVFEDIVPSISWLQSLDLDDSEGQFVKVTRLTTYNGGNDVIHKHFGFYETEFWGQAKNEQALINDDFSDDVDGQLPINWKVYNSNGNVFSAVVDNADGKVLAITDNANSGASYVSKEFTAQSGSELVFSTSVKFPILGKGERVQLQQGSTKAIILENSAAAGGLAFINSDNQHIKVADITADTWLNIEIKLSTDSDSYDIYLNGEMVWGGGVFHSAVTAIDKVVLASGWGNHTSVTYFDEVSFYGPIHGDPVDPVDPEVSTLLSDDFENGFSGWIVEKDSWTIVNDGNDKVLTKATTSGTGFIHQGDSSWSDYTVSADIKRLGQSSAILGRYQASNTYYQFAIKDNGTYLLNVNNNGSWSKLSEGSFSSNTSDYYNLSMTFLGNQITVSINGTQVGQPVINNAISSGEVGFRSQNGASSFDNLEVITP